MPDFSLLSLELRAPLAYRGIENPPLAGVPAEGHVPLPCPEGSFRDAPIGLLLAEGEEELFAFDEEDILAFDPDEGPRLLSPLPPPRFYGCSSGLRAGGEDGLPERRLPAGGYIFLQFRPADEAELALGLEWFAREAWWEGDRGRGPYFVRRVKEHEKLATQILRRAEGR